MEKRDRDRLVAIHNDISAIENTITLIEQMEVSLLALGGDGEAWNSVAPIWGIPEHVLQTQLRGAAIAIKRSEITKLEKELDELMMGKPSASLYAKTSVSDDVSTRAGSWRERIKLIDALNDKTPPGLIARVQFAPETEAGAPEMKQ